MTFKKLVSIRPEQKDALDEIQAEITEGGGYVTMMSLINDSIQIFIEYYRDEAIQQYTPRKYKEKKKEWKVK